MNPRRFAELRKAKGLTQQQLAEIFNLSVRAICMWEMGERKPPLDKLEALADFYGVTTDYLLGRTDIPNIYKECASGDAKTPMPETLAAHETEEAEDVPEERMEEIIAQAYRLIMANKKQK